MNAEAVPFATRDGARMRSAALTIASQRRDGMVYLELVHPSRGLGGAAVGFLEMVDL